jgi:outer membrane protein
MKQLSIILSVLATVVSGTALVMMLTGKSDGSTAAKEEKHHEYKEFKIAYFNVDSIQNSYELYREQFKTFQAREEAVANELQTLERNFQKKVAEWQQKGNAMSQAEAEAANRESQQLQQSYGQRKQMLTMKLESDMMEAKQKIKKNIEDFLTDYNKDKRYAFIVSNEPEFMFYKDTVYDITADVIKGLNEMHKQKKN